MGEVLFIYVLVGLFFSGWPRSKNAVMIAISLAAGAEHREGGTDVLWAKWSRLYHPVWQNRSGVASHGLVITPYHWPEEVFQGEGELSGVCALDAKTGDIRWKIRFIWDTIIVSVPTC